MHIKSDGSWDSYKEHSMHFKNRTLRFKKYIRIYYAKMNIQMCKLEPMSNAVRCTTMLCFSHTLHVCTAASENIFFYSVHTF